MNKLEDLKKVEKRVAKLEKLVTTIIKWIDFWETVKTPWKVKR